MKRTSQLCVHLEDSRNPEGEKERCWKEKAQRRGSSPQWFSCLGQMPFSLVADSLLPLCLHLPHVAMLWQRKTFNVPIYSIPHIYLSIMSWICFTWKVCSVSNAQRNGAPDTRWDDALQSYTRRGFFDKTGGRPQIQAHTTWHAHRETIEPSDAATNAFFKNTVLNMYSHKGGLYSYFKDGTHLWCKTLWRNSYLKCHLWLFE